MPTSAPTSMPTAMRTTDDDIIGCQIVEVGRNLATAQHRLIVLAVRFDASHEWAFAPTAAHWIAEQLDIAVSTAREWIRIGKALEQLPATSAAFADRRLSYSKVRALTRLAEPDTEHELIEIGERTPAGELGRELARWSQRNEPPAKRDERHHEQRRLTNAVQPDGMVATSLFLAPEHHAKLIAAVDTTVLRGFARDRDAPADAWPSLAQQRADALVWLITNGGSSVSSEIVLHVRGDGCTLDDGTPITATAVERIAPLSFIRALIHDAEGRPINASAKRRHPTTRQKRVVKERDRHCVDCRSTALHEYDHVPAYEQTGHTIVDELQLRCAPCHHRRHRN